MLRKYNLEIMTCIFFVMITMRGIIEVARDNTYQAVNVALVQRNGLLGRRIAEEELRGEDRAEYGIWAGDYQTAVQRADQRIRQRLYKDKPL